MNMIEKTENWADWGPELVPCDRCGDNTEITSLIYDKDEKETICPSCHWGYRVNPKKAEKMIRNITPSALKTLEKILDKGKLDDN